MSHRDGRQETLATTILTPARANGTAGNREKARPGVAVGGEARAIELRAQADRIRLTMLGQGEGEAAQARLAGIKSADADQTVLSVEYLQALAKIGDGGYDRRLDDVLKSTRFRPGTTPEGKPIRMKAQIIYDF